MMDRRALRAEMRAFFTAVLKPVWKETRVPLMVFLVSYTVATAIAFPTYSWLAGSPIFRWDVWGLGAEIVAVGALLRGMHRSGKAFQEELAADTRARQTAARELTMPMHDFMLSRTGEQFVLEVRAVDGLFDGVALRDMPKGANESIAGGDTRSPAVPDLDRLLEGFANQLVPGVVLPVMVSLSTSDRGKGRSSGDLVAQALERLGNGSTFVLWDDEQPIGNQESVLDPVFTFFEREPEAMHALAIWQVPRGSTGECRTSIALLFSRSDRVDIRARPHARGGRRHDRTCDHRPDPGPSLGDELTECDGSAMPLRRWRAVYGTGKQWGFYAGTSAPSLYAPLPWRLYQLAAFDRLPLLGYLHRPVTSPGADPIEVTTDRGVSLRAAWGQARAHAPRSGVPAKVWFDGGGDRTFVRRLASAVARPAEAANEPKLHDMAATVAGLGEGAFMAVLCSAIVAARTDGKAMAALQRLSSGGTSIVMVSPPDDEGATQRRQGIDAVRRTID